MVKELLGLLSGFLENSKGNFVSSGANPDRDPDIEGFFFFFSLFFFFALWWQRRKLFYLSSRLGPLV